MPCQFLDGSWLKIWHHFTSLRKFEPKLMLMALAVIKQYDLSPDYCRCSISISSWSRPYNLEILCLICQIYVQSNWPQYVQHLTSNFWRLMVQQRCSVSLVSLSHLILPTRSNYIMNVCLEVLTYAMLEPMNIRCSIVFFWVNMTVVNSDKKAVHTWKNWMAFLHRLEMVIVMDDMAREKHWVFHLGYNSGASSYNNRFALASCHGMVRVLCGMWLGALKQSIPSNFFVSTEETTNTSPNSNSHPAKLSPLVSLSFLSGMKGTDYKCTQTPREYPNWWNDHVKS